MTLVAKRNALPATRIGLTAALVALVACAAPRPPAVAGTLRYSGTWTHAGPRADADDWVTYAFEARAGDLVEAYVTSSGEAPAARVVDDAHQPLAESAISHPDGGTMAALGFHTPRSGTYYLLLRDSHDPHATFDVQLAAEFACQRDADCERAGEATGDPKAPSPLDILPYCMFSEGDTAGTCKSITRESLDDLHGCGGPTGKSCP